MAAEVGEDDEEETARASHTLELEELGGFSIVVQVTRCCREALMCLAGVPLI